MSFTFDLLREPWVPCIRHDGLPVELGLHDALVQAHELRELGGESPLVMAALYRLLLAILHRVFGPASHDEWGALWQASKWDTARLARYFEKWLHRFDLFDAKCPFYQATDDRVREPTVVDNMIHDVASGNRSTLFDHHVDDESIALTPAQAARMLVTAQSHGLGGLGPLQGIPFTDGSCARGVVFLAQGETLFHTLALNLVQYPDEDYGPLPHTSDDALAWEMDDPYKPRKQPRGYLDYLTWQARRIQFFPEQTPDGSTVVRQMIWAPALRLGESVTDPMKHYSVNPKPKPGQSPYQPLRFTEEKALWRDSAALFRLHTKGLQVPRVFQWLAELVDEGLLKRSQTVRYLALGMANDKAKVEFFRSEQMPLPLGYLEKGGKQLVDALAHSLARSEDVAYALRDASLWLAVLLLTPNTEDTLFSMKKDPTKRRLLEDAARVASEWAIERCYWAPLAVPFRRIMETLPTDKESALKEWRDTLQGTAWAAFEHVASNLEVSGTGNLKAVVKARDQLAGGLGHALGEQV